MPKIRLVAKGNPTDHNFWSPKLSDDEAAEQLGEINRSIAGAGHLQTAWCSVRAGDIIGAQLVPDSSSAGNS